MEDASAPITSTSSAAIEDPAPPPAPAGCRHAIAASDFAHVPDAAIRALLIDGKPGKTMARDCLGEKVEYQTPIAPQVVERFVTEDATHMAVFVALAKENGYTFHCPGIAALVRLDHDAIVTEGVGADEEDCDSITVLHTAMLDGHRVLLFPHVTGTGESGDFEAVWSASMADAQGALKPIGEVRSTRSMGNGSISSGAWFGAMDATILAGAGLRTEEHWDFVREADGGEEHGKKRTLIRTYTLDGDKLVMSPKNDPTQ
jgi:hypothetical protein